MRAFVVLNIATSCDKGHHMTSRINRRRKQARTTQEQWEWQGRLCFYCDVETWLNPGLRYSDFPRDKIKTMATREHLHRRVDGGPNTRDNVVIACHECNSTRGEMPWQEYLDKKEAESRSNCRDPENGYGLTIVPVEPTPDFRIENTYFYVCSRERRKRNAA
jgi:5-methylcytosine-specific restriction endonuclease McrA